MVDTADQDASVDWVVLTTGSRPVEFARAVHSIRHQDLAVGSARAVVVGNGVDPGRGTGLPSDVLLVVLEENVGIPAGRDIGLRHAEADIVGFLDDDAALTSDVSEKVLAAFRADPTLGAVALRLNDETGETSRRHNPRVGRGGIEEGGEVTFFVGAAHAIRAEAYRDAGGYYGDLWYGHEEIEFSWRLIDAGWSIAYLPDAVAFHPLTTISRHADGWRLTGRNRVWIARRTLPWPVAIVHVGIWLCLGLQRAPRDCKRPYFSGWLSGWRDPIEHRPIRWKTVWRLTRLGRPPVI